MSRALIATAVCASCLLLAAGCGGMDDTIQSNKYICSSPSDCAWGWSCVKQAGQAQGKCVNPADVRDGGVAPDSGTKQDTGLPPKQDTGLPPKPDQGVPTKKDTGTKICTPNTSVCVDQGHKSTCNATGDGYLSVTACPDFHRCEAGACIKAGDVSGLVSVTIQAAYMTFPTPPSLKIIGGVGASFLYNAPKSPTPQTIPLGSCKWITYGSSSSGKGVAFDAGKITIAGIPSGTRTLTFDAAKKGYKMSPPLSNPSELFGRTLSFSSAGKNLVHGAFSGKLKVPPKRLVTSPAHNAKQAKSQPLAITWSGATGSGKLRIDLLDSGATASQYASCMVADSGSFTVPAQYLSTLTKNYPATIVLLGYDSGTFTAKGVTSAHTSTAILAQSEIIVN